METKEKRTQKFNEFRKVCLQNVDELLRASKSTLDQGLDHISFHLSALALEEIGKTSLLFAKFVSEEEKPEKEINFAIDDHEKKLFWSIWWGSFGREKITKEQIEQQQGLAKSIHNRRLTYLYSDPNDPFSWKEKMKAGEAKMIYDLAFARYKMEESIKGIRDDFPEEEKDDLRWFFNSTEDSQKRKEIFGSKSQEKLLELGDVKKWIQWLRGVYKKTEEEVAEIIKEELSQQEPEKKERSKPKWKVRIKIISPSHSIKNNHLNEFNQHSDFIKLYKGDDSHIILVDLFLPKALPIAGLWEHGWGIARKFVVSLNIATRGLFWWNVPVDTAKYYDYIEDLERKMRVGVESNPKLELNWKELKMVLGKRELINTTIVLLYLNHLLKTKQAQAMDHYTGGVSLLAKNDVHLRLETNAFEQFFISLKLAMKLENFWDGKSDLKKALKKKFDHIFKGEFSNMEKMVDLGEEVEKTHKSSQKITLTEVIAMKSYCDLCFLELAVEHQEKKTGHKMRLVSEEINSEE